MVGVKILMYQQHHRWWNMLLPQNWYVYNKHFKRYIRGICGHIVRIGQMWKAFADQDWIKSFWSLLALVGRLARSISIAIAYTSTIQVRFAASTKPQTNPHWNINQILDTLQVIITNSIAGMKITVFLSKFYSFVLRFPLKNSYATMTSCTQPVGIKRAWNIFLFLLRYWYLYFIE